MINILLWDWRIVGYGHVQKILDDGQVFGVSQTVDR